MLLSSNEWITKLEAEKCLIIQSKAMIEVKSSGPRQC
jgi:hypothetical protein